MANLNYGAEKIPIIASSSLFTTEECSSCGQRIRPRCTSCNQVIREASGDTEYCEGCGQEIPSADEGEEITQKGHGLPVGYKWNQCANGVYRAKCLGCKRKTEECPRCHNSYEEEDDYSTDTESSESDSKENGESEEESDTENSDESSSSEKDDSKNQRKNVKRKRERNN